MNMRLLKLAVGLSMFIAMANAFAQTTTFTYQGRLTDNGNPANGAFQMQFKLFDALAAGSQIGSTIADVPVTVAQGIFTTALDFGAPALSGANRWLEIGVRHNSGESYSILSPREQVTSSPYAIRTLSAATADNALSLGGIQASAFITPSNGGDFFIRNSPGLQTPANFNIGGDGVFGGNVGIGTAADQARFSVSANTVGAGNNTAYFAAPNIGPNASNIHFGTSGDWYIRSAASSGKVILQDSGGQVGIGTTGPAAKLTIVGTGANGYSLGVSGDVGIGGNITQTRDRGGSVKAMALVDFNGIARCYNGVTGASTGNCGFTVNRPVTGVADINFGFAVSDRFVNAIQVSDGGCTGTTSVDSLSGNVARILTYCGIAADRMLFVFVY